MLNRYYVSLFSVLLIGALVPFHIRAQTPTFQDCLGAIPICLNSYSTSNIITGTGNIPNEINPVNSCLLTGERNDSWYIITTSSAGNLNISIIPNNLAHNYDWAIYNLTSAVCSDIFNNPALEIACNYSNLPGITGANGLPGAQNNPVIPVSAGETYLINVSGFSSFQQAGYTIDLGNSSAIITDNTQPVVSSITTMNCGATNLIASFSERVLCNSVSPSDFTLSGPGGPYIINSVTNTACAAGSDYSRDFTVSFSPAIALSGTYTLTLVNPVTDLCSNVSPVPQIFSIPVTGLNIAFQTVDVTCFGGNNGSATTIITGPPGPYSYQWSPSGGNSASAQWLSAGTYTVTVTTPLGCSAQASVTINQPLTGLTASAIVTPSNGCAANGSATITVGNGQPPFTYSWWPSGGNGATASNLTAGSYMVSISDSNQCVLNYFLTVPSASGPVASISNFNNVSCFGGNDGSATVSVTGASGPFTYQWLPSGGNSATATGLSAGNYSVNVIVAPGCTLVASVPIVQPPTALNVSVNATNTTCGLNNGAISLNASGGAGGYSWQWSPNISTGSSASQLAGGVYTVTVTDANGCSSVNTVPIASSTQPVLALVNHQDISCFGLSDGSTGVTASGGNPPLSFQWSSGQTSAQLNNIPAGTYTVTVTDASGCSASLTDILSQPAQLTASVQQVQHVKCFGDQTGSAMVSTSGGSGGNNWTWQGTSSASPAINNVGAGIYTATVTDQNGCSASVQVIINQPVSALTIQGMVTETTCGNNDGSVVINAWGGTAPYNYLWSNGSTSISINSLIAGIYTVTVTDQNSCTQTGTFTVQASDAPVVAIASTNNVLCSGGNDGSANLTVAGGVAPYSWTWQGNASTGPSAMNLSAGTYNVTVTDNSGCQAFQQVVITEPDLLTVVLSPASAVICLDGSVSISSTVAGGTLPYSYAWSNGLQGTQVNVTPTSTTTYSLAVTDAHGCITVSQPATINVLPPLSVNVSYPDSVCKGGTATVVVSTSGGDGNYTHQWNNGLSGSSNTLSIISDTSIIIIVSDGCTTPIVEIEIFITALNAPDVNIIMAPQSGCAPLNAQFNAPPGYNYLWNFGDGYTSSQESPSHEYTYEGIFDVSVTISYPSAGSCSTVLQFPGVISVYAQPVARFIYDPPVPTLNHPEVYFTDRSTGAVSWNWYFGDGSQMVTEQNPRHTYADTGKYVVSLKVQSDHGCSDSAFTLVHVQDELQVFLPNAFTPDGSGTNDYFNVYGVGFSSYELSIFDRWGKLVHYAKNNERAWDGNDKNTGLPVPQGLYVYKITIIDNAGNIHNRFNHVTVIR